MSVYELLKKLGASGIKLWLENEELKFKAPKGALTADLKNAIVAQKAEIINFLQQTKTGDQVAEQIIQPLDRNAALALSYPQQRLWFLDQLSGGDIAYNIPLHIEITGQLDKTVFEKVFQQIIQRHEILRTTFTSLDEEPIQIINDYHGWTLPYYDFSELDPDQCQQRLGQLIAQILGHQFDLKKGPLFRLALIKIAATRYRLVATMHHIISDGWSMGLLVKEMVALYPAMMTGADSPLPPLAIQYADFAAWQRQWLSGEELDRQLAYWQKQLQGVPVLELPADKGRAAVLQNHGNNQTFHWDKETLDKLNQLCNKQGVTLFMLLLSLYKVFLYKVSGQLDFAVGTPIANRTRPEIEPIIGFFVNTLALRSKLSADSTFIELLKDVEKNTLEAYGYQDVPFEKIVEKIVTQRDMSHTPLFQVMFVLQNNDSNTLQLPGLTIEPVAMDRFSSKFDLQLSFAETDQGLAGEIEYNSDLFEAETITRFEQYLFHLCQQIIADPEGVIDEYSLISQSQEKQIVEQWNETHQDYPRELSIAEVFRQQVEKTPQQVALTNGAKSLSYQELDNVSDRVAEKIRARLTEADLSNSPAIGICIERSLEQIITLLAVLKSGGTYVPFDPSYPEDRLTYMAKTAQVRCVAGEEKFRGLFDNKDIEVLVVEEFVVEELVAEDLIVEGQRQSVAFAGHAVSGDDPAYIMFTSGSTGQPKGIKIPHRGVVRLVKNNRFLPFNEPQVFLQYANFSFDAATLEIWGALLNGHPLVVPPAGQFDSEQLGQIIRDNKVTTLWLTAALFHSVAEYDVEVFSPLKYLLAGGDVLAPNLVKKVLRRYPAITVVNGYGPTENTTFTCCHPMTTIEQVGKTVAIGKPIANTQVYILDKNLNPVPIGVAGELCAAGDGVALGYLEQSQSGDDKFIDNPFKQIKNHGPIIYRTGDKARYLNDGSIEFLGRLDNQVKIRGYRIELGEIETALEKMPWIKNPVVIAKAGADGINRLFAYWEGEQQGQQVIEKTKHLLQQQLPEYMLPSGFMILSQLPINENGKVDRRALPDIELITSQAEIKKPENEIEAGLLEIWCELLKVPQLSVTDNFFEIGGHSLLATQVTSRIRKRWQVDIALRQFFEAPTIRELSQAISQQEKSSHREGAIAALGLDRYPASFAQKRLWLLDQLQPGSAAYHVPSAFRIRGDLDRACLEAAIGKIIQRHQSLRTVFQQQDELLFQCIRSEEGFQLAVEDISQLDFYRHREAIKNICTQEAQKAFDLASGPLYRFRLLQLSSQDHIALVTLHHIISDGWSMGVFIQEIIQCYEAEKNNSVGELTPLSIQYGDFAAWQNNWMAEERLQKHLDFFQQSLSASDLILHLPTDYPRPKDPASPGALISKTLSRPLAEKIQQLCQQESVSLYMLMLSSWQLLLARYSGQERFNIGSPVAGRNRSETENLIGFFINTVVVAADVSNNPSFRELLYQTKDRALDAFAHQDLPFEKLVEHIQPPRDLAYSPLFQVFLNVLNLPNLSGEIAGLLIEDLAESEAEHEAKFDFTLYVREKNNSIELSMLYRTDCYSKESVATQLEQLEFLLAQIVQDIEAPIEQLQLAEIQAEKYREPLLMESYPLAHELFQRMAARNGDGVAIEDDHGALSYAELEALSNQMAHGLIQAQIGGGDLVAIYGQRSAALVWAILGVMKAGAAFVILDSTLPAQRIQKYLNQCEAKAAITVVDNGAAANEISHILSQLPCSVEIARSVNGDIKNPFETNRTDPPQVVVDLDDLAYVIFTSGTSGEAKAVRGSYRPLANFVHWYSDIFKIDGEDRFSMLSGLGHDPILRDILVPLANGAAIVIPAQALFDQPKRLQQWVRQSGITVSHMTPSMATLICDNLDQDDDRAPQLRLLFLGGEVLRRSHVEKIITYAAQAQLYNCYGATETPQIISYAEVDKDNLNLDVSSKDQLLPVGAGAASTQLVLLNALNKPVATGEAGEIYVRSPYLALGYSDKNLTQEKFLPNPLFDAGENSQQAKQWYKTGDLGRYRADGQVQIMGRNDKQVKIRGYRVEPIDVQLEIKKLATVRDCIVMGGKSPFDDWQDVLLAYVVPQAGKKLDVDDFRAQVRMQLPEYMAPAQFIFIEQIPLDQNGKVNFKSLPEPRWGDDDGEAEMVAPRSATEEKLAAIWRQILKREQVSVTQNFFDLGGHSLLATQVVNGIQREFGIELALRALFDYPSVEKLADYIDTLQWVNEEDEQILDGDVEEFEI